MYSSTFLWLALPSGRGPNFTISLTYCIARLPSTAAGGPSSGARLRGAVRDALAETDVLAGVASLSLSQPITAKAPANRTQETRFTRLITPSFLFSLPAAWDELARPHRCSLGRARSSGRRRYTCLRCLWS